MRNSPGLASSPTCPRPSNSKVARPESRHTISSPAGCISQVSQSESKLKQDTSIRPLKFSNRWSSSCQMAGVTAIGVAARSGLTTTNVERRSGMRLLWRKLLDPSLHGTAFDSQLGDRDRQREPSRPGAAGIDVKDILFFPDQGLVRVAGNHDARLGAQIRDVVHDMDG